MQVKDAGCSMSVTERKEVVKAALATLKSLKFKVSELRVCCEDLKLKSEKQEGLKCSECGELIEQGEEVTLKDSFGRIKGCYHKGCFKAFWISRNCKFDYSSGFLRTVGAGR
jgi:hypothetical protein